MGLSGMSDSMSVLRESPQVVEIMSSLTSHFLAVMVGLVVTTVLQSSSATVGIVLLLAQQGLLDIRICYFIILDATLVPVYLRCLQRSMERRLQNVQH